ncbi:MAG TPA: hypothetical protein VKB37_00105 [Jatrophihabitantaceae bacterium]|jgi:hypothetical protein|nr:hypothetical protein [Jatrophihabitantaceae bacterium]
MPFNGAAADEQADRDFGVGQSVADQPDDLRFLRGEMTAGFDGAFADGLACRAELRGGRSAKPSMPIAVNISWDFRNCSRAWLRWFCRRNHSP